MQENKSIGKLTELLTQQKLIASDAQLGVVMPNAYDAPPITIPEMAPLLPGVKPCGSTEKNESCDACDKLAGITASLGNISDTIVRQRLRKAKEAIGDMCALIQGCSTSQARNVSPYEDGTACLCTAFMQLITSFIGTFNAALIQPQWSDKSRKALTDRLKNQEAIALTAITECYRRYRISDNKTSKDKLLEIIKTYS